MTRFFLDALFFLLAFLITCLSSQSIVALEIDHFHYCSVTIAQYDGDLKTILVLKIKLPQILEQLDVVDVDCSF